MTLSRRALLLQSLGLAASSQTTRPPNVIVILIDDMGATDFGAGGSRLYQTPHLDRMAREGVRFTNGYAACPVCSPTRASIMTGKYPARLHLTDWIPGRRQWPAAKLLTPTFEQQLPLDEITIAEMLKPLGYATASIGKWHLGGESHYPEKHGFDLNAGGTDKGSPPSYFPPYRIPGLEPRSPDEYLTDNLTARATRFIEENRARPFFLYLPHFTVHLPLGAKAAVTAKYAGRIQPGDGQANATYAAMVEGMDDSVGAILAKLTELGIDERTVVFFLSDNGGLRYEGGRKDPITSNAPFRAGKGHLYEGGIRIPFVVRWPGKVKPAVVDTPVCSIDLLPTIAGMTGAQAPRADGADLLPLLRSGRLQREALFWHYPHYSNQGGVPGGAIREGDFKLIEFYEDGRLELFDLRADVGERVNLARRMPERAAAMRKKLDAWRRGVDAAMPKPNPDHDPAKAGQGLAGAEPPTPAAP